MTKINKSNLALRCKRLANSALLKSHKLTTKRLKLAISDENPASSSDDDHWPLLPPTSSSSSSSFSEELSPIEEEGISESVSTLSTSTTSSTNSKYLSSFCLNSSITSISSKSEDEGDTFKNSHDNHNKVESQEKAENIQEANAKSQSDMATGSSDNVVVDILHSAESTAQFNEHHAVTVVSQKILLLNLKLMFFNFRTKLNIWELKSFNQRYHMVLISIVIIKLRTSLIYY